MSAKRFREYAEDCRRSAERLTPDQRPRMMEIARAWEACAKMIEDEEKKDGDPEPAHPSITQSAKNFGGGGAASTPRHRRQNE